MAADSSIQRRADNFKADRAAWYTLELQGSLEQYRHQKAAGLVDDDPLGVKHHSKALGKE